MNEFYNKGCGKCISLDVCGGYMLIAALERNEYIIAPSLINTEGNWTWGIYYKDLVAAVDAYKKMTEVE